MFTGGSSIGRGCGKETSRCEPVGWRVGFGDGEPVGFGFGMGFGFLVLVFDCELFDPKAPTGSVEESPLHPS